MGLEDKPAAGLGLSRGAKKHLPPDVAEGPHEEYFDLAASIWARAEEARGHHARVVHDDEVAGIEEFRKISKNTVLNSLARAAKDHEAGGIAGLGGLLRDQFVREIKVEVGSSHALMNIASFWGRVYGELPEEARRWPTQTDLPPRVSLASGSTN